MSLVTVHGSNTMYVESGFQPDSEQGTGDLYQTLTYNGAGVEATFDTGSGGSREPQSLAELREYGADNINGVGGTSAWGTGAYVVVTSPAGYDRNYHWDGAEWQSGVA